MDEVCFHRVFAGATAAIGNPLKGVPEAIESCRALTYVNLQETLIYSLPLELSRLPLLSNVGLTHQNLKPKLAGAYVSGTRRLMEYLSRKDEKRALRDQLRQRLRCDVRALLRSITVRIVCHVNASGDGVHSAGKREVAVM
jgi:hypothetical protein